MLTTLQVVDFIHTKLPYEQRIVYVIDSEGLTHLATIQSDLYAHRPCTIKIEGMERYNSWIWNKATQLATTYNHTGPITAHAFLAVEGSPSFKEHTDPDDVIILCCEGVKHFTIAGKDFELTPGDVVFIPRNTPHQAINHQSSLILSFGLERYLIDKC